MPAATTAGRLRFRVRFDCRMRKDGTYGGTETGWVEQFTRWADIVMLKGTEAVMADRLQGLQPALIIVRRDSETLRVDASWRAVEIRDNTPARCFALKSPGADMEGDRAFITMMAEAGAADG